MSGAEEALALIEAAINGNAPRFGHSTRRVRATIAAVSKNDEVVVSPL